MATRTCLGCPIGAEAESKYSQFCVADADKYNHISDLKSSLVVEGSCAAHKSCIAAHTLWIINWGLNSYSAVKRHYLWIWNRDILQTRGGRRGVVGQGGFRTTRFLRWFTIKTDIFLIQTIPQALVWAMWSLQKPCKATRIEFHVYANILW